jgi:hypothetical protein
VLRCITVPLSPLFFTATKPSGKTPIPRFKANQKDDIEEFGDDDSSAGLFGESKRASNNNSSAAWISTNKGKGFSLQQPQGRKKSNKTKKILAKMGMTESLDFTDDYEWKDTEKRSSSGSSGTRRETRSRSKSKAKKKDEVIEILDSSSEEESSDDEVASIGGNESSQAVEVRCTASFIL